MEWLITCVDRVIDDVTSKRCNQVGLWVHAVCTKSAANAFSYFDAFVESLDLIEFEIELGGIPGFDAEQVRSAMQLEIAPPMPPPFDTAWCAISYGKGTHDGFALERFDDPERISKMVEELSDTTSTQISRESHRMIERISGLACELISSRLPLSCKSTLCGPLARETAIWLATVGGGLAVIDGHWFDPIEMRWLE
ncbi:MAG: hypothetical protein AAFU85_29080 [Planctomycetota bacterium]